MSSPPVQIHVTLTGHSRIDFDRRPIRKALRQEAAAVRKTARRLVARRVVSQPDDYPGRQTGDTQRSIKSRLSKRGLYAIVEPVRTARMDARKFYPAILTYGVPQRRGSQSRQGQKRIEPRKNFIAAALDSRRNSARAALANALQSALIPRT